MKRLPDIERGLPEDIEPGALVYSKSVTVPGDYPKGGIVTEIIYFDAATGEVHDDPIVRLSCWDGVGRARHPYIWETPLSDLDAETATFFARGMSIEADNINRWLNTMDLSHKRNNRSWVEIANSLQLMAVMGEYTQRANLRYEEARAAKRVAQKQADFLAAGEAAGWVMTDEQAEARAAELAPKLEAAINEARARRGD